MNEPYVIAVIPAHNEAKNISAAIKSIRKQVDWIIVACDNCTDQTALVAHRSGANQVFSTIGNHARKAGALNQALENYVNWDIPNLYIMVMDADTQIVSTWMSKARQLIRLDHGNSEFYIDQSDKYDAVGSVFYSARSSRPSVLELCQHNEWVRYANKIRRDRKVFVLTGTCSLISAQKLLAVHRKFHRFYDERSLTEDFAMTVDLKSVGTKMISPLSCVCSTRTMPTYADLVRQRRRWYLGALELIFHRKMSRTLLPYVFQQLLLFVSVAAFVLFLMASIVIYVTGDINITLFWTVTFLIFDFERVISIWQEPIKDRIFAASMVPELYYTMVLQWAYLLAWVSIITHSRPYWNRYRRKRRKF